MNRNRVRDALSAIGPAVKGSLVEVRKPCIRPGCPACKSGRKHRAFMFHYAEGGRRRCMYVPRDCVTPLREALRNGRLLEECLHEAGPAFIRAWRKREAGKE
jgi:hypothetical protein